MNDKVVYKYQSPLLYGEVAFNHMCYKFLIPKGKILDIGIQDNQITVWVELDVENKDAEPTYNFVLHLVGTGAFFHKPTNMPYFKTLFHKNLVWHIYISEIESGVEDNL